MIVIKAAFLNFCLYIENREGYLFPRMFTTGAWVSTQLNMILYAM